MVMMIHIEKIERDRDDDVVVHFRYLDSKQQQPVGELMVSSPIQLVEFVQDATGVATDGIRTAILINTQSGSRYLSTIPRSELVRFGTALTTV